MNVFVRVCLFSAFFVLLNLSGLAQSGIISTAAGNGNSGFGGDGGPATLAQLFNPYGVASDSAGNLYIADTSNNRIRKVTPAGIISTVVGNGSYGFSGDGGRATSAQLAAPRGVAMDAAGKLYIADYGNNRIRKVTAAGIINTVAGNGNYGFSGDGGPALSAQLSAPTGVAVDAAGDLYIMDSYNNRIRKITGLNTVYFAQVAVGDGLTTVFTFGNNGSDAASGTLIFKNQQGSPFTVSGTLENPESAAQTYTASSFPISIPPGSVGFLTAAAVSSSAPASSGWAQVQSSAGSLYGVATFLWAPGGTVQSATGVLPSNPVQFATIPVDDDNSQGQATAYAIANPSDQTVVIKLGIVDQNGNLVADNIIISLGPGQHLAKYLNQDFNRAQFKGSIILRAQGGGTFVAVALIQRQNMFTVIPVNPGKAPYLPD